MEKKQVVLFGENGLFVDREKVEKVVYTEKFNWLIVEGISVKELDKLNEANLTTVDITAVEEDCLAEVLESMGYSDFQISTAKEFEESRDVIVLDVDSVEFFDLRDCETQYAYSYWDGGNMATVIVDEEIEVATISDKGVSLDEWDGSNWQTEGNPYHQRVQKIYEIDDEKAQEDSFLLVKSSRWQGDHATGSIMSLDELKAHLTVLNRNHEEYLPEIQKM